MAEKNVTRKSATIGLRLDPDLLRQIREFANAHPLQPPLTGIINDALRDWLAKHKGDIAKPRQR